MKRYIKVLAGMAMAFYFYGCSNDLLSIEESASIQKSRSVIIITDSISNDYYWSGDRKVYLEKKLSKQYVTYLGENSNQIESFINTNGFKKQPNVFNQVNYSCITPLKSQTKNKPNIKWEIIEGTDVKAIGDYNSSQVLYNSPYYIDTTTGNEIGISHLFYVKLKSKESENILIKMAEKYNVEIIGYNEYMPLWYTLSCTNESHGKALEIANIFYESKLFETAEPDIMANWNFSSNLSSRSTFSNDTYYTSQWNLKGNYSINWESAYTLAKGDGVTVAVIDTGIELLHPDLDNITGGYDTVEGTMDSGNRVYGPHGTACAGIIGATVNNGIGIAGIAPNISMYSICNPLVEGPNVIQQLANGLSVAGNSVDVISCSWGHNNLTSSLIRDAIYYNALLWGRNNKGAIVVFATGNESSSQISFPANCLEGIITVGSIGRNGTRSSFSNYGTELDVVAPGENIATTDLL